VTLKQEVTYWEQEVCRLTAEEAQVHARLLRALRQLREAKDALLASQRRMHEYQEDAR
jgi:hypothetical protein